MKITVPQPLKQLLTSLEGRGYKAYKSLQGKSFDFPPFLLKFEHVQGDPFAGPTRLSVSVDLTTAGFDEKFHNTPLRRLALEDFLLRMLHHNIGEIKTRIRGSGKSGLVLIQAPGQKILKRNAVLVEGNRLQVVLYAGLPSEGRTILGKECLRLFDAVLPPLWVSSLLAASLDTNRLQEFIETLEDYEALQGELRKNNWVAFVASGSLLPRASGISDRPLTRGGIRFQAPEGLKAEVRLPHKGRVEGMPVPRGITLIVGGGFHGKSTLLRALQDAVYPHIPGDGRERVATVPSAVKIRAEDGRSVRNVNISGFMDQLPLVESTLEFSTQSASGSTSQAVNILEAIEAGAEFLLMDEDTCATNFMIRDGRMQKLIASDREPITPYVDRIAELYETLGVSTLLVMGGCGDYFDAAHHVIGMEVFEPRELTEQARRIVAETPGIRKREVRLPFPPIQARRMDMREVSFDRGKKECVIQTRGLDELVLGRTVVSTRGLEQFAEEGQLAMCGWILRRLKELMKNNTRSNVDGLKQLFSEMEKDGFAPFTPFNDGLLTLPRLQEVMAVLNRIR